MQVASFSYTRGKQKPEHHIRIPGCLFHIVLRCRVQSRVACQGTFAKSEPSAFLEVVVMKLCASCGSHQRFSVTLVGSSRSVNVPDTCSRWLQKRVSAPPALNGLSFVHRCAPPRSQGLHLFLSLSLPIANAQYVIYSVYALWAACPSQWWSCFFQNFSKSSKCRRRS